LPYGEMTLENIRSTVRVREKSRMRLCPGLSEALLVLGFGGVMVLVCGPLGTVDPVQVQHSEGKVMIG